MNTEIPDPHTKLYSIESIGETTGVVVKKEHTVPAFFTVTETIELMKLYANACVGKKMVDMGYKNYVDGDPEADLAEIRMTPWFRENET